MKSVNGSLPLLSVEEEFISFGGKLKLLTIDLIKSKGKEIFDFECFYN